ncbi:WbuC family cupin fold metalloprotein [Pseudomonas sp. dw_358]|uniref:WbuC family cupin fold metalloprotein n=1 Tax=Pseudomonas sp. dw_358 TaxID=2720083 RepID=UPI001BD1D246|nr:WbuC family cupin fold metalloprotein [Pseudomonas sp. dw_358]
MKQITRDALSDLAAKAQQSPRLRANLNLHEELSDPIQRLAIAMEPGTYIRAQFHAHTWELLFALSGRFVVLIFDDAGVVIRRTVLGEESTVVEIPADCWHAVLSLDAGGVIFEVKHGPYLPIPEGNYADWTVPENALGTAELMAWYSVAQVGDCYRQA